MAKGEKISLCMIVKNEEKNIERCLNSVKDYVYEMIVVDTGSTDRTVELAKALGARVYFFEWIDDFAAARNFSISKAKGDWILWLDADEYMTQPYINNLKTIVGKLNIMQLTDRNAPRAVMMSIANLNNEENGFSRSQGSRLFKRDPRMSFKGRVHEQLDEGTENRLICYNALSEIMVLHTGYTNKAFEETGKIDRNEKLLLEQLKETPEDFCVYSHLADVYEHKKDFKKALEYYKRALELSGKEEDGLVNNKQYFHIIQDMIQLEYSEDEILGVYKQAVASCSEVPDFDFQMGSFYRRKGNSEKALYYFEKSIEKMETGGDKSLSIVVTRLPMVYRGAIDAAIAVQQWGKAVKHLACLLKVEKYDMRLLQVFIGTLLQHSGAGAGEIINVLLTIYDKSNPKDKLYLYKSTQLCSHIEGSAELLELIYALFSDEEKAML